MRIAWVALIPLLACGSSDEEPEATPILERAPRAGHECAVTHEPVIVARNQQQAGVALARAGGGLLAARGAVNEETFESDVALSALGFDPVELAPPAARIPGAGYWARPALVVGGGALGIAWVDDAADFSGQELRFAVLDEAGQPAAEPLTVAGADDEVMIRTHALAGGPGGFGLLWADDAALRFVRLDERGEPVGEPITARDGSISEAHLARRADGHAAAWIDQDGVHVALLPDGGGRWTEPRLLAGPGREGTRLSRPFVAASGDDLVVAWTETSSRDDYVEPGNAYALVRLARVSGDGEPLGPPDRLQAGEYGFASAISSLLAIDGQLAVAWSRETFITVCAGCMSDAVIRVALLDPVDLVPVSEAVELVGPSGLRSAPMVVADDDGGVAFFMNVDYHAIADLAAARIRCTPTP